MNYVTMSRKQVLINTDPQRRCYNGVHYKSELVWTCFERLDAPQPSKEKAEDRLKFWKELNDFAVSQRGKSARCEFKIMEQHAEICVTNDERREA